MSGDYSSFLSTEEFADVTLRCNPEVFRAHKVILAHKSPVFSAMFKTPMIEATENYVLIEGVRPDIFRMVLKYIYSDKIQEMDDLETICELMSAAHMYSISCLVKMCSNIVKEAVSEANCLTLLKFADVYDAELKEYVMNFISERFKSLKKDEQWEALVEQKPSIVIDVLKVTIDYLEEKNCALKTLSNDYQQKNLGLEATNKRYLRRMKSLEAANNVCQKNIKSFGCTAF